MIMVKEKTSEQLVYEFVKAKIISKSIKPGTRIVEKRIVEEMHVSRTPIRSALKKLGEEGYVYLIENRGAFVVQPTIEDIGEAYEMYKELQYMAVSGALEKFMEDDITNLKRLVEREKLILLSGNMEEFLNINCEFHRMIARINGNKYLIDYTKKIIDRIMLFLVLYDDSYKISPEHNISVPEHTHIIELMEAKKLNELREFIKLHLDKGFMSIKHNKLGYRNLSDIK